MMINLFYSTPVLLMAQPQGDDGGGFISFLPLVLVLVVFYFFMIRPQQKRAKKQQEFRESLKKGDKVVTQGGLHGKIAELRDNQVVLDLGNDQRVTVEKWALSLEGTQGTPAGQGGGPKK